MADPEGTDEMNDLLRGAETVHDEDAPEAPTAMGAFLQDRLRDARDAASNRQGVTPP